MKIKLIVLSLFLFTTGLLSAQVKFTAEVSREDIGINERLRVDFNMNKDGDNFTPPSFTGFAVVGGPNQQVSNRWVNGKSTFSKTYSYYLEPTSKGNKTIGQAEVKIEGTVYKTTPVNVKVGDAVERPQDGNNSNIVPEDNLHFVAEISKANPYLNEAVTVVYKLYVSPRISVSNYRMLDNPSFPDFWSQALDSRNVRVEEGTYRGEPYRYVVLYKTLLYPQKTGKLEIDPLAVSVSVDVPSQRRSIFGGVIYQTVEKRVTSNSREIDVKPLPTKGKPANFSGAVGSFEFDVEPSKTTLDAGESLTTSVKVRGRGNLMLFELPDLTVPSSLEIYEPERKENFSSNANGTQGSVAEDYTIVPSRKGKYPIPGLNFSYFDPRSETYRSISTEDIIIDVENGPVGAPVNANANSDGANVANTNKQAVTLSGDQFRYIKLNADLKAINAPAFFRSWLFWALLILPLLVIPIVILFGKKREARANDVTGNKIRKADKLARKYLSEARKNLGEQQQFYIALERAMHNYLKAKLHIQTGEMSKERISEVLASKGVDNTTITQFIEILKSCEFARYTPASMDTMKQDYDKAASVISTLDKQL
ncbi:BatD family protein [Zunongwangia endophytica]|uniref:BatD family protein n=1 Tax=Zunongwangia endophytica TaxID=1808945 RepID=A0ABV8H6B7_9FLAO|nr:BatD family protein [Zunongwangia endophytica]MDN3596104.1 BatD family protein [Zunongwangia endophytica]